MPTKQFELKILFFTENLRAGGKERRIIELLKFLKHQGGFQIELVITRTEIHYSEFFNLGIPLHVIERKGLKKDPRLFFSFYRIAKRFKPDVINTWGNMVSVYAIPTKFLLGIPLVNSQIVDAAPNKFPLGKNVVFHFSNRILSNSKAGLVAYKAPVYKSRVIYNGFDFKRIQNLQNPESIRATFKITTPKVVGMVASYLPNKDHDTFVTSALNICSQRSDVSFICLGDGDFNAYQKRIPENFKSRILFFKKQEGVESIMDVCSIGVLTTNIREHGEGISNALVEFMALGKPVVATEFGGTVELIEDGQTGFLVPAFDPLKLSEKIRWLLDHPEESKKMGAAGRNVISKNFSLEKMMSSYIEEFTSFSKPILAS